MKLYFCPVGKWNRTCEYNCFILNNVLNSGLWHKYHTKCIHIFFTFSWWQYNFEITFSIIKNVIHKPRSKQCVSCVSAVYSILINIKEDTFLEVRKKISTFFFNIGLFFNIFNTIVLSKTGSNCLIIINNPVNGFASLHNYLGVFILVKKRRT